MCEYKPTQGELAVKLTERLGLDKKPSVDKAVALLTLASLKPDEGWSPKEKVTEKTLVRIQASVSTLLYKLSRKLKVPAPPTLSLQVLEPPYAPQTIIFSAVDIVRGEATEGQFAKELAKKLGLGKKLSVKKAILLLSSAGIKPDTGWKPEEKASDVFVVRIQVSILNVLESAAHELQIPVPPTFTVNIKIED